MLCSANSYPFGFTSRSKRPPIDILKFIVTTWSNHDKKVSFIWVDKDEAIARSSELVNTCYNIYIIVQTKGGNSSSLNGIGEIPTKTLSNITGPILVNSIHNKELW